MCASVPRVKACRTLHSASKSSFSGGPSVEPESPDWFGQHVNDVPDEPRIEFAAQHIQTGPDYGLVVVVVLPHHLLAEAVDEVVCATAERRVRRVPAFVVDASHQQGQLRAEVRHFVYRQAVPYLMPAGPQRLVGVMALLLRPAGFFVNLMQPAHGLLRRGVEDFESRSRHDGSPPQWF